MTRTSTHLRRTVLDTIARLSAVLADLPDAVAALADAQPGYPTATGGAGGTANLDAAGNPPGLDRYLTVADPAAHDQHRLAVIVKRANDDAADLGDIVARWSRAEVEGGRKIERQASGADCLACGRYCSGATDADRLRSGLCDSCRKAWARWTITNPLGERGEWMLERRRTLAAADDDEAAA